MGAVLLAAGRHGQALRPAEQPDHDPPGLGGFRGNTPDVEIQMQGDAAPAPIA